MLSVQLLLFCHFRFRTAAISLENWRKKSCEKKTKVHALIAILLLELTTVGKKLFNSNGIKFRLQKRWGCCESPLPILACCRKMFISDIKTSKRERSGRPSTSTDVNQHVNKMKQLVLKNRLLTVKELTDTIGISEGSVKTIWKDLLGLWKVKSRLVPKTFNFLEKNRRVEVCETMLSDYQNKLICIIKGDETWI